MAMLTVSESTIYGRFGFAPAAMSTEWEIDTRRARWTGPASTPGRVEFVTLAHLGWRDLHKIECMPLRCVKRGLVDQARRRIGSRT